MLSLVVALRHNTSWVFRREKLRVSDETSCYAGEETFRTSPENGSGSVAWDSLAGGGAGGAVATGAEGDRAGCSMAGAGGD